MLLPRGAPVGWCVDLKPVADESQSGSIPPSGRCSKGHIPGDKQFTIAAQNGAHFAAAEILPKTSYCDETGVLKIRSNFENKNSYRKSA
ncbi:hypothetical protein CEXT_568251 [Caerostris extrusa]|uniref:Uncharacterized protein n=1 Tax=Caerostris extrusa TaxID=172846 RepID=A0AAV4V3I0_CAEEX|nr:hypothetical protein CEXT_568251 [Caerostris extrusa]